MPKLKNILIFTAIAAALVLVYIFWIKPSIDQSSSPSLVSSGVNTNTASPGVNAFAPSAGTSNTSTPSAQDFLSLLLNVQTITLDDSIFSDPAFSSLHDSSITLIPDNNPGRPNPFAQLGSDATPVSTATPVMTTTTQSTTTSQTTPGQ